MVSFDFTWKGKETTVTTSTALAEENAIRGKDWFFYFESPKSIWLYDGASELINIQNKRDGIHGSTTTSSLRARTLPKPPSKLLKALPTELQQKARELNSEDDHR